MLEDNVSNYAEEAIINCTLRGVTFTGVNPYIALATADLGDADTTANEAKGGDFPAYARQAVSFSDPAGSNSTSNGSAVSFPAFDGAAAQTYSHIGIYDALSGGNLLYHTPMNFNKTLTNGDVITFSAGSVTVTLD